MEKILNALKGQEKETKINEALSPETNDLDSNTIPQRFKRMDPDRPRFSTVVRQISKAKAEEPVEQKSFKSLAQSVLSNENRVWRQQQVNINKRRAAQLLVMGGKSFLVDEDGHEEEVVKKDEENIKPSLNRMRKQDSVQSANSFKSDWSDDEQEELEKQLEGLMKRNSLDKELTREKSHHFFALQG